MAYLGVLFSLDEETVSKLKSFESDEDRLQFLQEEIEPVLMENEPERFAELDKAWDALHRSLADGELEWHNGLFPLNQVVIGGESLYSKDDYIMSLKSPHVVQKIAEAVQRVSADELRTGYNAINAKSYGMDLTDDDFDYVWYWFQNTIEFWKKASLEKRFVLFTADQ